MPIDDGYKQVIRFHAHKQQRNLILCSFKEWERQRIGPLCLVAGSIDFFARRQCLNSSSAVGLHNLMAASLLACSRVKGMKRHQSFVTHSPVNRETLNPASLKAMEQWMSTDQ
ncbi:hypothetical protein OUZ56_029504 [Daphnia magna]|uniref:Uncharacterized protein n=1 Tax=Daphnia magna TaxID=35525 RepID=A0ABR0B723_9CRUS|nr:hypothetical protein OUZ56_029504 [Daphnia magna]